MGKRDYRSREAKKPKKEAKKILPTTMIVQPPMAVEVIKKGKKQEEEGPSLSESEKEALHDISTRFSNLELD